MKTTLFSYDIFRLYQFKEKEQNKNNHEEKENIQ